MRFRDIPDGSAMPLIANLRGGQVFYERLQKRMELRGFAPDDPVYLAIVDAARATPAAIDAANADRHEGNSTKLGYR